MPITGKIRYRIRTYPSGKRVRVAFMGDKVVETKSLTRTKVTKSAKRLNKRRRRIGR